MKQINNKAEFNNTLKEATGLVVVDFTASWCAPCKVIAPFFESLAQKYPDVVFCKVDCDANQDIVLEQGVSAFPTFKFYVDGKAVDEMLGVDQPQLESKVVQHKGVGTFTGKVAPPAGAAADAPRGDGAEEATSSDDAMMAQAFAMSMAAAVAATMAAKGTSEPSSSSVVAGDAAATGASAAGDDQNTVPLSGPVDETLLAALQEMGFSDTLGRKGIVYGRTLEGALEWISAHQDEPDVDQPFTQPRPLSESLASSSSAASAAPTTLTAGPSTTSVTSSSLTAESITVNESREGITAARLEKIDRIIATVASHRVGSAGGHALKLLNTFVSNVHRHPREPKYRSINAESNAFKSKLVPVAGSLALLHSVGFHKSTVEEKIVMLEAETCLLWIVSVKLELALQTYVQQNGPL